MNFIHKLSQNSAAVLADIIIIILNNILAVSILTLDLCHTTVLIVGNHDFRIYTECQMPHSCGHIVRSRGKFLLLLSASCKKCGHHQAARHQCQ